MTDAVIRGCRLAYDIIEAADDATTATPMVWTHGLSSSRADDAELPLVDLERVATGRPVLRYDARGHGLSGDLTDPADGAWAEMAHDLIGLVDHAGYDRVVLAGASMGTATSLHAALHLGARVEKLVLVIPPTGWETRRDQIDAYLQMAAILDHRGVEPLITGMAAVDPPDPFRGDDAWRTKRTTALRRADPERLAAVFRGAAVADLPDPEALQRIEAPTLILAWSGDPGHPVSTAERLGELLPHAEVVVSSTATELASWTDRTRAFLDG
ncbi:MAG: alpha/beta fold hydrolase [Ilumatobacteraceae bacterium]